MIFVFSFFGSTMMSKLRFEYAINLPLAYCSCLVFRTLDIVSM